MTQRIVIGTRGSALALAQTRWVATELEAIHPGLETDIEIISTKGDEVRDRPLSKVGGKGLFTKELEVALLDGSIDLAVHSLKDLPTELPDGLMLGGIPEREDPRDALVCTKYDSLDALPEGATVGTSSLRRQAQLRAIRPDLSLNDLRGNIDTRVQQVLDGKLDAVLLAAAGLRRLGRASDIREAIAPIRMLPAPAQGALGIECRADDLECASILSSLTDYDTMLAITAERTLLAALEGGCSVPIGALAIIEDDTLTLDACVAAVDGSQILRTREFGPKQDALLLGERAAAALKAAGAADLIRASRA